MNFRRRRKPSKREYLQLTANSDNPSSGTISFGALLDRYLEEEMPERHSTNLAYRSYLETHIRPKSSEWNLRKLTSKGASLTIEQWLKSLDLAPKTKGNIRNVMTVVFNCAMRRGLLDLGTNPLSLVRVKGINRRQTEPRVLSARLFERSKYSFNVVQRKVRNQSTRREDGQFTDKSKKRQTIGARKSLKNLVAGGGFEPPTFGL